MHTLQIIPLFCLIVTLFGCIPKKKEPLKTIEVIKTQSDHQDSSAQKLRSTEIDAQKIYELTGVPLPVSFSLIETQTTACSLDTLKNSFDFPHPLAFATSDTTHSFFTEKKPTELFLTSIDSSNLCSYYYFKTEGSEKVESLFSSYQQLLITTGWKITEQIFFTKGIIVAKKNKNKAFCLLKQSNTKKTTYLDILVQTV